MMQPHNLGSGQVLRLVSFLSPSDVPTARAFGNLLTRGGCRLSNADAAMQDAPRRSAGRAQ